MFDMNIEHISEHIWEHIWNIYVFSNTEVSAPENKYDIYVFHKHSHSVLI